MRPSSTSSTCPHTNTIPRHEGAVWCVSWVRLPSLPLSTPPPSLPPSATLTQRRATGSPKIRQHPRLLLLRRQSPYLARIRLAMDHRRLLRPTHCLRQHRLLVTPRIRLSARLRLLGRPSKRLRIPRGQLDAPAFPCARCGRQCGQLGPCSCAGQLGQ